MIFSYFWEYFYIHKEHKKTLVLLPNLLFIRRIATEEILRKLKINFTTELCLLEATFADSRENTRLWRNYFDPWQELLYVE